MAEICDSLSKGKSKEYVRKGVIYFMNCPFNKNNKKRKCQDRPTIHHDYGKNHKSHYNDNNCNRGSSNSSLLIEVIIIVASEAVVEVVVIVFPSAALVLVVVLVEVVIVILVASVNNSNISSRVWKVAVVEIVEVVVLAENQQ